MRICEIDAWYAMTWPPIFRDTRGEVQCGWVESKRKFNKSYRAYLPVICQADKEKKEC